MLETTDCAALPQPPLFKEEVCLSEFCRFVSAPNKKNKTKKTSCNFGRCQLRFSEGIPSWIQGCFICWCNIHILAWNHGLNLVDYINVMCLLSFLKVWQHWLHANANQYHWQKLQKRLTLWRWAWICFVSVTHLWASGLQDLKKEMISRIFTLFFLNYYTIRLCCKSKKICFKLCSFID